MRITLQDVKDHFRNNAISWIIGILATTVFFNAENWVENATKEYLVSAVKSDTVKDIVLKSLNKNMVGSTSHVYFHMGRKDDPLEYPLVFYVSKNQEVQLYIKATHYGDDERRRVQIVVGDTPLKNIDISKNAEYKQGVPITIPVREAIAGGSYDFNGNIQKVLFRQDILQETSNHVLIEAFVTTIGIPTPIDMGGEQ